VRMEYPVSFPCLFSSLPQSSRSITQSAVRHGLLDGLSKSFGRELFPRGIDTGPTPSYLQKYLMKATNRLKMLKMLKIDLTLRNP
jgi:hypothetical protein